MHISALSPFGPIFAKELRTAARRKRNYLLRVFYLGSLLLFLVFAYETAHEFGPSTVASRAREQEALGWAFFMCFSFFSVSAMALIGPILTSTAINGERLAKTFHVLLMTPINAWQIAAGKLFSRLLTALVLLLLSMPVLALVRLLGGVELSDMFGVILLAAVTCLTTAALGLLLSTLIDRTYVVILLAYAILGFFYMLVPFMTGMMMQLASNSGSRRAWMFDWMRWMSRTNPIFCVGFIVAERTRMLNLSWYPCVFVHLGITAVLLMCTGLMLRRIARREGGGASPRAQDAVAPVVSMAAPALEECVLDATATRGEGGAVEALVVSAPVTTRSRRRTVGENPILWREIRRPLIPRWYQRIMCVIGLCLLLGSTYVLMHKAKNLDSPETHAGYAWVFDTVFLLMVCVLSGTAIAQEKESDTWTTLLSSPLSARAIVWGKFMGILVRLFWWFLLIAAHFVIFAFKGYISWTAVVITLAVIISFNSVWLASGLYLSLRLTKVTAAVIVNLLLPVLLYGGASLVLVTLESMFDWHRGSEQAMWYVPYFYLAEALTHFRTFTAGYRWNVNGPWQAQMPGTNTQIPAGDWYSVVTQVCVIHLLCALLILIWTTVRFNRIVGRAPEVGPAELFKH
jgi:ABC-type transport system involved in multi-copper enzyme maturation permease subunit